MESDSTKIKIKNPIQPIRDNLGASIIGPTNPEREAQNPDTLAPPSTDHGTLSNLRWSFADSHNHISPGGCGRQTTARELPISTQAESGRCIGTRLLSGPIC